MNKIFYDPKTLEIKGASDGEISMSFPFLETDFPILIFDTFKIILEDENPVLKVKGNFTNEEWEKIFIIYG